MRALICDVMREWASAPRWRPRYFGVSTTLEKGGPYVTLRGC